MPGWRRRFLRLCRDERMPSILPAFGAVRIPSDIAITVGERAFGSVPARPAVRVAIKDDRTFKIIAGQRAQPFAASTFSSILPSPMPGIQMLPAIFSCGTGFQMASGARFSGRCGTLAASTKTTRPRAMTECW